MSTTEIANARQQQITPYIPAGYEVAEQVTRSVLRQEYDVPFTVEFETAAADSEKFEGDNSKKQPPRVAHVINLETGELQTLIMNKVLESELERYTGGSIMSPKGGYKGMAFAIVGFAPRGKDAQDGTDRRYRTYRILELRKMNGKVESAEKPAVDATSQAAIEHAKGKKK